MGHGGFFGERRVARRSALAAGGVGLAFGTWLAGAALAAPPPSAGAGDAAVKVTIQDFHFDPPTLEVPVGATVTWVNRDEEPHTILVPEASLGSAPVDTDETFSHRFTQPGRYEYRCALHPFMKGTIVVRQAGDGRGGRDGAR
ncbi:MAG TPA: cupredoxin family copper-binding protein [Myxococcota bacterium]|jgi:plastocyanin|nr:cupredoxin family copper-binding protein [Myxococcota bacterium]